MMKKQDIEFTELPDAPGVYYFLDIESNVQKVSNIEFKKENILYIGKATSLRGRVKSYFDADIVDSRGLRIVNMVIAAKSVAYEETANVMEALLLENILIKKYQPYYNAKEKDNKSYVCVVITNEDYPRVLTMRVREYEKRFMTDTAFNKKAKVYGPYTSAKDIRETLKIIRKILPYRDKCEVKASLPASPPKREEGHIQTSVAPSLEGRVGEGPGSPCFNAQIGLCPGVCTGIVSIEEYAKTVRSIQYLFEGRSKSLIEVLEKEMRVYAKDHNFELAANRRDTIYRLQHINDVALINNDDINEWKDNNYRIEAYDIAHISGSDRVGVMTVVEGGVKQPSEYRKFKLESGINDDYAGIRDLITRRMGHTEWRRPDLIVWDGGVGQKSAGDNALIALGIDNVATVAVVKDDKHKAKDIIGNYIQSITNKVEQSNLKKAIYLANSEAHRFSISWHRKLRDTIKK